MDGHSNTMSQNTHKQTNKYEYNTNTTRNLLFSSSTRDECVQMLDDFVGGEEVSVLLVKGQHRRHQPRGLEQGVEVHPHVNGTYHQQEHDVLEEVDADDAAHALRDDVDGVKVHQTIAPHLRPQVATQREGKQHKKDGVEETKENDETQLEIAEDSYTSIDAIKTNQVFLASGEHQHFLLGNNALGIHQRL